MGTPYRADHVGSFLRPAELLKARQVGADPQRLRAIEDRHIQRVLARQKELGFEIFTDGELRRRNFMSDLIDAVEGFDTDDAVARSWRRRSRRWCLKECSTSRSTRPGIATTSTRSGAVMSKTRWA